MRYLLLFLALCSAPFANCYSVLTHEEVVDMAWKDHMVPLLLERYPGLTEEQLREAHSYAYGGSLIQDLGYYPFGNKFFSDLLHYVRTGDFVEALLRDAKNPDELAFALGALAHYSSDRIGHPFVNQLTADEFKHLRKKYGAVVTYEQDKTAHIRTEFGLDVVGVAKGAYSQDAYRDFIGFHVARGLLDQAFEETYALRVSDLLHDEEGAIRTYRWAVCELIPRATKAALMNYDGEIEKAQPGYDRKKFRYRMNRTEFEKSWSGKYQRPGFKTRFMAFLIAILPKIGPLKILKLKLPDGTQQMIYLHSVNETTDFLFARVDTLRGQNTLVLEPINLDTGEPITAGRYQLSDEAYARLLDEIVTVGAKEPMRVPVDLRKDIAGYFSGNPRLVPSKEKALRKIMQDDEVQKRLLQLKQMPVTTTANN